MKKPTFIILMWCLFVISQVASITIAVLIRVQREALAAGDLEKSHRIIPYFNELSNV